MEKIVINGSIPLKGEVNISGAKNAVVALHTYLRARMGHPLHVCRSDDDSQHISSASTAVYA